MKLIFSLSHTLTHSHSLRFVIDNLLDVYLTFTIIYYYVQHTRATSLN